MYAQHNTSQKQWSLESNAFFGHIIKHNDIVATTLQKGTTRIYDIRLNYRDFYSNDAAAYRYPELGIGFSVIDFSSTQLWEAPSLGNMYALYGSWNRKWLQYKHLQLFYSGDFGFVYNTDVYNQQTNPHKNFSSNPFMIYIGWQIGAAWQLSDSWFIQMDGGVRHYSNGRLGTINTGFNILGGDISLSYYFSPSGSQPARKSAPPVQKRLYYHLSAGGGIQTYLEDWLIYWYDKPEQQAFREKLYPKYFVSSDAMYRISRKYGCGLGMDVFYVPFTDSYRKWDQMNPDNPAENHSKYSSWSVGLAFNQEFYYNNIAFTTSLGYYLYRDLGIRTQFESRLYQRAGLRYYIPAWNNLFCGFAIKAHQFSKAEYFELSVGKKF